MKPDTSSSVSTPQPGSENWNRRMPWSMARSMRSMMVAVDRLMTPTMGSMPSARPSSANRPDDLVELRAR